MRILLLCHAFNCLTQRLFVELQEQRHEVTVEFDINDEITRQAVELFQPDLIIAPYLKRAIPETIWKETRCLVVHPGIIGDRGPSALDWAILNDLDEWGVTVLQANAEMDGGDIWASVNFPMRKASKASLYRNEVTEAAATAINLALQKIQQAGFAPQPQNETDSRWQPLIQQSDRSIDWQRDDSATVIRKIRSADGFPGVKDHFCGRELYLFDASPEPDLSGKPGELIGRNETAICIATIDSAVWIGHLQDKNSPHPFKLPATMVIQNLPFINTETSLKTHPIQYHAINGIGYLSFNFYNGAMSTEQCHQLREALVRAKQQPTQIILLMGGSDFWSNGIHLNQIEAAQSTADESWNNINAMDDLALEIINTENQIVISALQGNAGAGGVFLARAADEVW
ncbi:MAG: hydrogenase maturation protein, partial [Gammaproteobacteria bacterium]|nr:hydrogenase maturation protein [Gammaproteobacteria bacterium]